MKKVVMIFLILMVSMSSSNSIALPSFTFTDFYDFLAQYEVAATGDQPTLLDAYMSWQNSSGDGFPAIINATHVVFIYYNTSVNVTKCEVLLDIFENEPQAMTRLEPGLTFFYLGITVKPSTRANYRFSINETMIEDPRNPYRVKARLSPPMFDSELILPPFEREFLYRYDPNIPHGEVTVLADFSTDPFVQLYLPPNYNSSVKYPVAYFGDGYLYTNLINACMILDNLIAAEMMTPIVAVFADWSGFNPDSLSSTNWNLRYTFYSTKSTYLNFLDSLLAYIDSHFSTVASPYARLHVGLSLTGYVSAYVAVERSNTIKLFALQSAGPASLLNTLITNSYTNAPSALDLNMWISVGTYETRVEGPGNNLTNANIELSTVCASKEWDYELYLTAEGHSFASWTHSIDDLLMYFFPSDYIPKTYTSSSIVTPTSPTTITHTPSLNILSILILLIIVSFYRRKRL